MFILFYFFVCLEYIYPIKSVNHFILKYYCFFETQIKSDTIWIEKTTDELFSILYIGKRKECYTLESV